jgi:hypothetical protein
MRKPKIRYEKEDNYYILTINRRFYPDEYAEYFFGISYSLFIETLTETYNASRKGSRSGYPKYVFTTKAQAKAAVEWLKTLLMAIELSR